MPWFMIPAAAAAGWSGQGYDPAEIQRLNGGCLVPRPGPVAAHAALTKLIEDRVRVSEQHGHARRMSRSNPRHNPPARDRRASHRPGAGRALFAASRGTTMSFRSRAAPRQGPGIMRRGDLCRCSRRTISCAVL